MATDCQCDSCALAKSLDEKIACLLMEIGSGPATIKGGVDHNQRRSQNRADLRILQESRAAIICDSQDHKVTHVCL